MKIYKDVFTGDELASDAYPCTVVLDAAYEFQGKFITKTLGADFDIGANDSAEVANEKYDAETVRVINIVDAHRLTPTTFDKKSYLAYIKSYMKKLKTHLEQTNPGRVEAFQKAAQEFVKKVIADFSNYDFYMGETMDLDKGQVVLLFYKEDGTTPYFYVWKDGVSEEKY